MVSGEKRKKTGFIKVLYNAGNLLTIKKYLVTTLCPVYIRKDGVTICSCFYIHVQNRQHPRIPVPLPG